MLYWIKVGGTLKTKYTGFYRGIPEAEEETGI